MLFRSYELRLEADCEFFTVILTLDCFSIAAHETIECQYDGEELAIGFKSQFITEVLSNMSCGELVMKFLDSKRAALVVPAETEEESEKLCGIIMPIMIS